MALVDYLRRNGLAAGAVTRVARVTTIARAESSVGALLRTWRQRRRMSQLDLSIETGVSARHLSFVETGRSRPSPEVILRLAEQLDVPLAERNVMLIAGGYAPAYPHHPLSGAELAPVLEAVRLVLNAQRPYPALLVDHHWHLVEANDTVAVLTAGAKPHLLTPPINVLRLSLHPDGMAPHIVNLPEWRSHLLNRLRHQAVTANDPALFRLHEELCSYPCDDGRALRQSTLDARVVVPLEYRHQGHTLALFSTTTTFGTPLDVTVAGLAVEAFFPANQATASRLHALANA
jgi:transcriptional regulator with XRE-family HTH domain